VRRTLRAMSNPSAEFSRASLPRALWQIANTLPPFLALCAVMAWTILSGLHYGWTLLLALPAAALYVRLFILQHDCGHGSLFAAAAANRRVGAILGVLTLFPFAYWKKTHALHHATSGDLDRRVLGDIRTHTLEEYRAHSRWQQFCYRFYRSMPVMLGIGPIYQFVFKHRLPIGMPWSWKKEWRSVAYNDLALLAVGAALCSTVGWRTLLGVYLPVVMIAGAFGVWLFYVQHTFESGYWERHDEWDARSAAVAGSSFYDLPPLLRWITANIGYHHIHHLAPRIPNYRLQAAHESMPPPPELRRMSLRDSLPCAGMKLWDEESRRMVGFPPHAVRGTARNPGRRAWRQLLVLCLGVWSSSPAQTRTPPMPANAFLSSSGNDWECDRGFRRSALECLPVQIPANAHEDDTAYGSGWRCNRGYRESNSRCVAVVVPKNAYPVQSIYGPGWECSRGFRTSQSGCDAIMVPANAYLRDSGTDWECDRGFTRRSTRCVPIEVPEHGFLDSRGDSWRCERGFRKEDLRCVALKLPANAQLDYSGNGWRCREGFRRDSQGCSAER